MSVSAEPSRTPVTPVVVYEGHDVEVYEDVAAACGSLEAYDVRDGSLGAYDGAGDPLEIVTRGYEVVDMVIAQNSSPNPDDLQERLRAFIREAGPERIGLTEFESASLDTLLYGLLRFFQSGPVDGCPRSSWFSRLVPRTER